jgi:glycosyltransferase involved in cell wall biosynthesis
VSIGASQMKKVLDKTPNSGTLGVLHISTTDNLGGSGRSAYRVHTGLRRLGVRSRMLVGTKATEDPEVDLIAGRRTLRSLDDLSNRITGRLSWQYLFYPSSFALLGHRWLRASDVVQLYNTHGGYFTHTSLPLISRRRPVVWRLSDMWPMTGHCAYSFDCERWKTGCGSCPILSDPPELYRDTTAELWRIKERVYSRSRLTIVAPSRWIEALAKESPLLGRFQVRFIPNGLDTETFRPVAKEEARRALDIDPARRVVLFSAHSIKDPRKGADLMQRALEHLRRDDDLSDVLLLVVGSGSKEWADGLPFEFKSLEHTESDERLRVVYSAADIFVLPTIAENLPNGILESMACATPSVTFDVGGCPDAVRHMETGYLAAHKDASDLARGIRLLLEDEPLRLRLARRCREVAEAEYALELQARRFKSLYEELTAERAMEASSRNR